MPTVCGEEEVGRVLALEPPDLVDLLLNLQGLEVVELGLVRLQGGESSGFVSPTLGTVEEANFGHISQKNEN